MSLYICNFSTLDQEGNDTCDTAYQMNGDIYDYQVAINENLAEWSGESKKSFDKANDALVEKALREIINSYNAGKNVLLVKQAIYELEDDLSKMNI